MTAQTNAARTQKSPQKNNQQKNAVRFALATAATIVTLFGAQTLAFAGKTTTTQPSTTAQVQSAQVIDTTVTDITGQSSQDTTDTTTSTNTDNQTVQENTTTTQITQAVAQPNPRSKSSR